MLGLKQVPKPDTTNVQHPLQNSNNTQKPLKDSNNNQTPLVNSNNNQTPLVNSNNVQEPLPSSFIQEPQDQEPPDYFQEPSLNLKCGHTFNTQFNPSDLNSNSEKLRGKRIVNSVPVVVADMWPWLVAIYQEQPSNDRSPPKFKCSGTLISNNLILTSAFCLSQVNVSQVFVSVGSNRLASNRSRMHPVDLIRIHEGFLSETRKNDIALIRLKDNVPLSIRINTICLPTNENPDVIFNKNVVVSGW